MKKTIILLDLISHETMHIPFNEGYIRVMRNAFPDDDIIFAATAGHISNMDKNIAIEFNIKMEETPNLRDLLNGKSPKKCWHNLIQLTKGKSVRLVSLLGAVGPLIHTFSKQWHKTYNGNLHFIQHDQFARMIEWRSKNIITKHFDYLSVLGRGLPERQKLIVLELGLKNLLSKHATKLAPSIVTIEHPVLESEWLNAKPLTPKQPIKVAFLGNCGKGKGFDKFLRLAEKFSGDKYQFYAIGKNNIPEKDNLSFSGLTVLPANGHMPRERFIELLEEVDMVCLPLPTSTSYVSSGSIIDAFAGLKPLIITENQSILAIQEKYGKYGEIVKNQDEMDSFFEQFTQERFQELYATWQTSLLKIRTARAEEALGKLIIENLE